MSSDSPQQPQRPHAALPVLPLIAALAVVAAFAGLMVGAMAFWGGDHMGMHGRGSSGADQTPVVSSDSIVTIEMRDYEFFPAKLTVDAGADLTFVNRGSVPHNAVGEGGAFDTGRLDRDDSASVTLNDPGVYRYVCTYHSGMEATVTVR